MILLKNRDRNPSFKKGEYVEINDAGNYPMELSVDGVCEQETTKGYQLLDITNNFESHPAGGGYATYKLNEKGGIELVSGNDGWAWSYTNSQVKVSLEAGTYIASANLDIRIYNSDGTQLENNFTLAETANIGICCKPNSTKGACYIMVEQGSTAHEYEPYTGGQPSPSPDYPQEIKTITGNLKLTSCGKNLYFNDKDVHSFTPSTGGWKFLNGNGGADISESNKTIYKAKVEKDKTYTFIANIKSSASISSALMYDDNQKVVTKSGENITYNHTFIAKKSAYVLLRNYVNSGVSVEISNVMLVEGQATEYEPYQGSSLNITIPSNEFAGKIGDIKDTLNVVYKDDGQYHLNLYKNIGKVVLDGSENLSLISTAKENTNLFAFNSIVSKDETFKEKSNRFQTGKSFYMLDEEGLYCTTSGMRIRIKKTTANSLNDFKSWLSTHNTEVYYPLAEPYEVDLGIVDTLLSYDNITNVFSDSDLYPVINVKYYKDFEFDKILRSGYNIDEQEYEIAKKQMANGKRKRILSSYDDCIIKINLGLLDNKTYQEYKEQLDDGEFHYWSYKYNQYKKANFILTKPSITTEYAYDDDIGIDDMEITLEKSSDIE